MTAFSYLDVSLLFVNGQIVLDKINAIVGNLYKICAAC